MTPHPGTPAGNRGGVPEGGALRCVQALMSLPQSSTEVQTAIQRPWLSSLMMACHPRCQRPDMEPRLAVLALLREDHRAQDTWRRTTDDNLYVPPQRRRVAYRVVTQHHPVDSDSAVVAAVIASQHPWL